VSDRVLRFPDRTWDELEGCRNHLEMLPIRRSFTCSSIWYTVTERTDGPLVIVVQYIKADT
jgi:hypothetical protein